LKKAGNEFKACCPFHQEKTPSFWVNDQKGFYHCFGCGAHGDAIRWLTDNRGLSFMDAVKQLAEEVGLELPKPDPKEVERQERAANQQGLLEAATEHFSNMLASEEGAAARAYLERRNVASNSIDEFRLGYAPDERTGLAQALKGYSQQELIDAGLLVSVEERVPYDRFRNRLMVPIRDPRGRIIAFGGRIVGDGEPKYLNSPDTALFDKGRVLFNLDLAGPASRQAGRILVVEGYFDVIALCEAGVRETVAPMGTALTEAQLEQLWRLVDEPILCFDGDTAGRRAAERACIRAMESLRPGKQLRVVLLPGGQDPDDVVRGSGRAYFEKIVETSQPLAKFLYQAEIDKIDATRPEQRANVRKNLEELARKCPDRFVADEFARSFKDLFFEDFGWKAKDREKIFKASVRTSKRVAPDLSRLYVRSALYGLSRFPSVAAAHLEDLAAIRIAHPDLQRWRDAIADAVVTKPDLSDDGIREILEASLLPETLRRDIRYDLRFGFTGHATPRERALKQLEALVQLLSHEQALVDEMQEHDKAALKAESEDRYAAVESARQRLREERYNLIQQGTDWEVGLH
jgi:DNA primase